MRRRAKTLFGVLVVMIVACAYGANRYADARNEHRPFSDAMRSAIFYADSTRNIIGPDIPFVIEPGSVKEASLESLPRGWLPGELDPEQFPGIRTCRDLRQGIPAGYSGSYGLQITFPAGTDFDEIIYDTRDHFVFMGGSILNMDFDMNFVSYTSASMLLRLDIDRSSSTVRIHADVRCLPNP